jgi:hypothetical protein
VAFANPSVED